MRDTITDYYAEYSVPQFIDRYPEQFRVLPIDLQKELLSKSEYIVRVTTEPFLVEFGFEEDDWIFA